MDDFVVSSRARVFAIPELFELIILQLPPHDLLLASRISKTFHETITTSTTIQSALFFRPIIKSQTQASLNAGNYELNPLLEAAFPGFLSNAPQILEGDWDIHYGHFPLMPKPNDDSSTALYHRSAWSLHPKAFARKDASWRRMLVCQPPIMRLILINRREGQMGTTVNEGSLDFQEKQGLRMGTFYDYLFEHVAARRVFRPTMSAWTRWVVDDNDVPEPPKLTLRLELYSFSSCILYKEAGLDMYRSEGFESVLIPTIERRGRRGSWDSDWDSD